MKKLMILVGLSLLISISLQAQKNKRTSAYMYNKNGEYAKAKDAIDQAVLHEKTMHDAKTWMYRGEIYYNIAANGLSDILDPNAVNISYESLMNAKKYDESGNFEEEVNIYLSNLGIQFFSQGIEEFQNQDYTGAMADFETTFLIGESVGRFDTIAAFNVGMAGVYAEEPTKSIEYLAKCIEVDYADPRVYKFYSKSVKQTGDTTKAIEAVNMGRERFPNDLSLMLELAQIYLETGENDKLREALLSAIEADPENSNLYLILGQTYDNDGEYEKAIEYYQKSIDMGGVNANVYYNIGAIYSNEGKALLDEANNLPLDKVKEYEAAVASANVKLEQAMPYFEKALELNPDDQDSKLALKNIYSQLKMLDKLKDLNASE